MHADIAIIGGGLVGYTAALMLARAGFSILLLESKMPDPAIFRTLEARAIGLAHTSCILYQSLGLWPDLQKHASPIHDLILSQQNAFGKCRINAHDYQIKALGHVVPATEIAASLFNAVQAHPYIEIRAPFEVNHIETFEKTVCINQDIHTQLVLACDGTESFAQQYFNLNVIEKPTEQMAIVANLSVKPVTQHRAFQRYTDLGVLALLPLGGERMTSVLTLDKTAAEILWAQSDVEYLDTLQSLFGRRSGLLRDLGKRFSYPIIHKQATHIIAGRTVLMGNAAHTISPIAAQGLNIALRDLSMLYDRIMQSKNDPGCPKLLAEYARESQKAQTGSIRFTEHLNDWVKPSSLRGLRSAGLFALDHSGIFKHRLARALMGFSAHSGKLMREGDHV